MTAYPEAAAELAKPINELLPMLLTYNDKPTWIKWEKVSALIHISSIIEGLWFNSFKHNSVRFKSVQFNSS